MHTNKWWMPGLFSTTFRMIPDSWPLGSAHMHMTHVKHLDKCIMYTSHDWLAKSGFPGAERPYAARYAGMSSTAVAVSGARLLPGSLCATCTANISSIGVGRQCMGMVYFGRWSICRLVQPLTMRCTRCKRHLSIHEGKLSLRLYSSMQRQACTKTTGGVPPSDSNTWRTKGERATAKGGKATAEGRDKDNRGQPPSDSSTW